nr:pentatricopeptide repeat protein AaPPR818 [Agave angustifolia]
MQRLRRRDDVTVASNGEQRHRNRDTVTVVLKRAMIEPGKQLHAHVIKNRWDSDEFVGSCLIDFYAKNQILEYAQVVFDIILHRDAVSYNTLISDYSRLGHIDGLISMFIEMGSANLVQKESTLVALLNGCANFRILSHSKQFHVQSVVRGFSSNETIQGITVDMYSKVWGFGGCLKSL